MELGECGLTHSRVYPVDHYTCAFACMPVHVRVLALHRDYYAFDLSKCFHYIALGLTENEEPKRVLTEFLTSGGERMKQIAEFCGKDIDTAKKWFHAFSNCKQKANCREWGCKPCLGSYPFASVHASVRAVAAPRENPMRQSDGFLGGCWRALAKWNGVGGFSESVIHHHHVLE